SSVHANEYGLSMLPRIVITGIGTVTSIGMDCETFWNNLMDGRSGIAPVSSFDTSGYGAHYGSEIREFRAEDYVVKLRAHGLGRASQLAIAAARSALADAGLDVRSVDPDRFGVSMGTTSGEPQIVERFDDCYMSKELDRVGAELVSLYPCHVI